MKGIRKNISNLFGWRTKRKLVVIESDDWGSIRTRSKEDYEEMLKKGLSVDKSFFTRFDSLESNEDIERLFNTLSEFKDLNGRHPVFTPMCIVANPDFEQIKDSGFKDYFFKSLKETIQDYPKHDKLIDYWQKGASERLFVPALHGREHLNVGRYLKGLQDTENKGLRIAFQHGSIGASKWNSRDIIEYLGAFHPDTPEEILELKSILKEAVDLFSEICGYNPTHFIGPNREPAKELDHTLAENGVLYITQSKFRKYPKGSDKYGYELNWLGKKNRFNQTYIMRNCSFEPSYPKVPDYVDHCLSEIENAFRWNKPASDFIP